MPAEVGLSDIPAILIKPYNASSIKADNIDKIRDDIYNRFYKAPDLANMKKQGIAFLMPFLTIKHISNHFVTLIPIKKIFYQNNGISPIIG